MTFYDSKSALGYLNKLVDEYNNTYLRATGQKPLDADYSALTEDIETHPKSPEFKVGDSVRITNNIFSKAYMNNRPKEIFVIHSVLKTNPWTYKIKDLHRETRIGSFYEK